MDNPNLPPEFELDGAKLRALRAADAPTLFAYLKNPVVTERTSYPDVSLSLAELIIEKTQMRWATGELSKWGLARREDDQIIGTCGFNNWSKTDRWAEIAFDLAPEYWGTGLMRRAVTAVLHWTFQHDYFDRVLAYVRVDNERSQRFLQRNGFTRESCLKDFRICKGIPHDFYVYRSLQSDWTAD